MVIALSWALYWFVMCICLTAWTVWKAREGDAGCGCHWRWHVVLCRGVLSGGPAQRHELELQTSWERPWWWPASPKTCWVQNTLSFSSGILPLIAVEFPSPSYLLIGEKKFKMAQEWNCWLLPQIRSPVRCYSSAIAKWERKLCLNTWCLSILKPSIF